MNNLDRNLWRNNLFICGVDEVGRGALAGPVVAAAVILPQHTEIPGVCDSKLLTHKKREELAKQIKQRALAWAVTAAGHRFIDRYNIRNATFYAMRQAVLKACARLQPHLARKNIFVLADGWRIPQLPFPGEGVIRGDQQSISIASASIIAKVYRDHLMEKMDHRFPGYGLARHKGYGTSEHRRALLRLGPAPIHRHSFQLLPRQRTIFPQ